MKKLIRLMLICGGMAVMNSCNQQNACEEVSCLNGGECVDGSCQCPDGFSGPNCEITNFRNGVFIVHEGNFLGGNASLSFYNKATNSLTNHIFDQVNGIPLGDVAQSMEIWDGKGYIVVNNSGKIEVVSLDNLQSVGTLSGLTSPRYIAFASDSKAYVSDLFSGNISIFNPQTLAITGSIPVSGQVEHLLMVNNQLLAAGTGANKVYRIDPSTDAIIDSANVGVGPSYLALDANGKVWVLTNGGFGTEEPKLVRLNPSDMQVELTLSFPSTQNYPGNLEIDGEGNTLYYVDGQVYQMEITSASLPSAPFASAFAYKCGVDPYDDLVYVSDAGDFNSNGKVYRYQPDGTPVDTFNVSVIPGEYAFTGQ